MIRSGWKAVLNARLKELDGMNLASSDARAPLEAVFNVCHNANYGENPELTKFLAALAARHLARSNPSHGVIIASAYRNYCPVNTDSLPETHLRCIAALLYERNDYAKASELFEKCLCSEASDERTKFLLAYSYEGLGRERNHPEMISKAIAIVEPLTRSSEPAVAAEAHHCLGHLFLARAAVGTVAGDRREGIRRLESAARAYSGYISCFASAFAELGDYDRTISESTKIIDGRGWSLEGLGADDRETVLMEVKFYLAYAYSCRCAFEKAAQLFSEFQRTMERRGRNDACNHAKLFLLKNELKRMRLTEIYADSLQYFTSSLRAMAFVADTVGSHAVGKEKDRYLCIIRFLEKLNEFRRTGGAVLMQTVQLEAEHLVETLESEVPGLVRHPVVSLVDADSELTSKLLADDRLKQLLKDSLVNTIVPSADGQTEAVAPKGDFIIVVHRRLVDALPTIAAFARERYVLALVEDDAATMIWPKMRYHVCTNPKTAAQRVVLALAITLLKRFLIQDEYVFALAPCDDSPALRYQRPLESQMCFPAQIN